MKEKIKQNFWLWFLKKVREERFVVTLIMVTALLLSAPLLLQPMQSETDAYARHIEGYRFYQEPIKNIFNFHQVWLPFHFSLLSLSFFFYDEFFMPTRIMTTMLSVASIGALYLYLKRSFYASKAENYVTLILFLFFPLRIILSTQTMSEPVFMLFFLGALAFLCSPKPQYGLGLVFLNIAHGIRYESWLLLPLFWYVLFQRQEKWLTKWVITLLSLAFPIFWVIINFIVTGSPFFFYVQKISQAHLRAESFFYFYKFDNALDIWFNKLNDVYGVFFLIFTFIGLAHLFPIFKKK